MRVPTSDELTTSAAGSPTGAVRLLVISAGMVLFTVTPSLTLLFPTMPTGEVGEQLARLTEGMGAYQWGFVNAALINPALEIMLYAAVLVPGRGPLRPHEADGGIVVGTCRLLPALAYISQLALLPRMLQAGTGAEAWYLGNPASVSHWLADTVLALVAARRSGRRTP